jgi:hypothetical protein
MIHINKDFSLLERGDSEWEPAWSRLAELVDIEHVCPRSGEQWQYMGTHRKESGVFNHDFRHRSYNLERKYLSVQVSEGWERILTCNHCSKVITEKDNYADLCEDCEFIGTDEVDA